MKNGLFRSSRDVSVRSLGGNRSELTVSLPKDADGRAARECPRADCSPGYFKIKPGTGLTGQTIAFCPYCRHSEAPNDFVTQEQQRYAKDLVEREALKGIDKMLHESLGLGSNGKRKMDGGPITIEMSLKSSPLPIVRRPIEDEVRRDVVCPHCALDQTVFGLAVWCADCGKDIFLSHIAAEVDVTRLMLADIGRRQEILGRRVAAKDLENCLEDGVSIFEAALRALVKRKLLLDAAKSVEDIERQMAKLGNAFQNIGRTRQELKTLFDLDVVLDGPWVVLAAVFEKRHPITHNLGVVDKKYLERAQASELHGREIRVLSSEVEEMLIALTQAVGQVHVSLFGVS